VCPPPHSDGRRTPSLTNLALETPSSGGDTPTPRPVPPFHDDPAPTSGPSRHAAPPCLNCGDPDVGRFCPSCGQRQRSPRASVRALLADAAEALFGAQSRLPGTLSALFLRPGHLSEVYLKGQVARYMAPFRVYLFSSVAFFVLLGLVVLRGLGPGSGNPDVQWLDLASVPEEELPRIEAAFAAVDDTPWYEQAELSGMSPRMASLTRATIRRFATQTPWEALQDILQLLVRYTPSALFVLLPLFALLFFLFFGRSRRYYVEHLVFVLHLHAFVFAALALEIAISALGVPFVGWVLGLWIPLYLFLATRRVYGESRLRSGLKLVVLGVLYGLISIASLPLVLLAGIFLTTG
jgi:hypothetical protein